MPIEITERFLDPDDPDDWLAQKLQADRDGGESPWVEPDYRSIPADHELPVTEDGVTLDEERVELVWPGPALVMPAGLLPDGKPTHPRESEAEYAERITGKGPYTSREADIIWRAYVRQQNALRKKAGLPRSHRGTDGKVQDTPETLAAIAALHEAERQRRRGRAG
ncbi:MAG TPA: hypothetical protein VF049_05020 [Nocardioidaceae bacterium]